MAKNSCRHKFCKKNPPNLGEISPLSMDRNFAKEPLDFVNIKFAKDPLNFDEIDTHSIASSFMKTL